MVSQVSKPPLPLRGILAVLSGYQKFISPLLGSNCRFYPTCSEYARQAFLTHGIWKGLYLSLGRILRCQPLCQGGENQVPPRQQQN